MKHRIVTILPFDLSAIMKVFVVKFPVLCQIVRYGVVGVFNNSLGYLIYLVTTFLWLEPKVAITVLYPVGAFTAYLGHSKYSFACKKNNIGTVARYILAHLLGYGVNFLMLVILADKMKLPHQIVQASAIVVVAGILFLTLRYFVFSNHKDLEIKA